MNRKTDTAILVSLALVVIVWGINGAYLSVLSKYSVAAFWVADLAQWVVLPGVLIWFLARRHGVLPAHYGFDAFNTSNTSNTSAVNLLTLAWSAPAALTFYAAYFWVTDSVSSLLGQPSGFFKLEDVFPVGVMGDVVWIYSAVSAGLIESIFFIGLPWLLWSKHGRDDKVMFTLVWSLIFAAVHWEQGPHVVAGALAFNLVACAWYFRLRSLWPIVIGHAIVDLIAFN